MNIVLVAIGNELLNGKIQDKNTHWLSKYCQKNGFNLLASHLIPDEYEAFEKTLNNYQNQQVTIITSGGLGPTKDDKTKEYLSKFFSLPLEFNQEALDITKKNYLDKRREYNKQYKYEFIPAGAKALYNEVGFAPALKLELSKLTLLSLPGVPREFNKFIENNLNNSNVDIKTHLIFKTKEIGETYIFNELVPDLWSKLERYGPVASLPHTMAVDISVQLSDVTKRDEIIDMVMETKLREHVWNIGHEPLEEIIIKKAKEKKITIGFAESCTGGLLSSRITDISGSSTVFLGGICSYANQVKTNVLGVKESTLEQYGAVSTQCAQEMAQGAQKNLACDIAISTTGIAGPNGGSKEKPVGTVCIGVNSKNKTHTHRFEFQGERLDLKEKFSSKALFLLFDAIQDY